MTDSLPPPGDLETLPPGGGTLRDRIREMTPLEQALWALAIVLAGVALIVFVSVLIPGANPTSLATPTLQGRNFLSPPRPSLTPALSPTPTVTANPIPTLEPLVVPTPPSEGVILTFSPNPDRTGWVGSKELGPHWRDRNLHGGSYQGQALASVLQFDLRTLAPGSRILYAALEITGRNAKYMGTTGEWKIDLLDASAIASRDDVTYDNIRQSVALTTLAGSLGPKNLATGLTNRFIFTSDQLKLFQKQVDIGTINLRLSGPSTGSDNLFTWDAGPGPGEPTLYVVAIPTSFAVITTTPTPDSLFAAATAVAQQTRRAQQFGTPTPLPRAFVTATPGATVIVVVTNTPTPANAETAVYRAAYATAMAVTTGTLTPLPSNYVTATPAPLVISVQNLTPTPTATATPRTPSAWEIASRPLPPSFYNKIMFLGGSRQTPSVWVTDPDGKNLGLLTDRSIYDIAAARDTVSPNGIYFAFNAPDHDQPDILQIWLTDLRSPGAPPQQVTFLHRGLAFAPAWSPDGGKVAYVSSETRQQEIFIFDLNVRGSKQIPYNTSWSKQITFSVDWFWNQFPSWSPDGKRIVFNSDRGHAASFTEIWIMDANGSNAVKLGDGKRDAWAPVWVKWKQ